MSNIEGENRSVRSEQLEVAVLTQAHRQHEP